MFVEIAIGLAVIGVAAGGVVYARKNGGSRKLPDAADTPEHLVVLRRGQEHVRALAESSVRIEDGAVAVLVAELGVAAQRIYDNLKADPRDLAVVRNFVDYHAPKCAELVEEYRRVAAEPASAARDAALESSIAVLRELAETFNVFYRKCLENDVEGLAVLSESMRRIGKIERPVLINNP